MKIKRTDEEIEKALVVTDNAIVIAEHDLMLSRELIQLRATKQTLYWLTGIVNTPHLFKLEDTISETKNKLGG